MNPLRPAAIALGRQPWLPRYLPVIVRVDQTMRRVSRGRFTLLTFASLPELFLTVPGRKSGIARTTPLLCVPDQGSWLVAGSNWGAPKPPVWVANLRAVIEAGDTAVIEFKGREVGVRAEELSGPERSEAWAVMVETWPNYRTYATRTERLIPVFRLTRA
ncbi:nitroreductase/quinone reductase family protein [Nocardioides pacificus]